VSFLQSAAADAHRLKMQQQQQQQQQQEEWAKLL
jgi:hypothetical protein